MEKMLKKATGRAVAVLLAVIMVFAPFSNVLGQLGWLFAGASGDSGDDTVHSNTSYSNGEYSVLYGDILLVGSGFGRDISATLAAAVGVGADRVKMLSSVNAAISQSGAGSLVVYACGTKEYSTQKDVLADAYAVTLTKEVENLKATGADVLLVTPGPVVEYGAGMYYSEHTALWSSVDIATGSNITNFLSQYVSAICSVATEQNVGVLSLYDLAAIYGEEEYMSGTADGVYPADSGYALMTRWIAEYISEGYVISDGAVKSVTADSAEPEVVIDLGAVYDDIDAVTVKISANKSVPESLSVYTTKAKSDQWFEAVADVKSENTSDGVYSASLMFSASRAQYVRIKAEGGKLPAGTVISVHKTRLTNPVITYPAAGGEVTTKQAFNLEWSAVAGADRYEVTLKTGDTVVTSFTTGDDVQTVPKGILVDGTAYTVGVKSIRSGYTDLDEHSGTGSCAFTASENAPLSVSSESINENVSADKLFTVGEQAVISSGKGYTGADTEGKLTDGNYETVAATTGSALVCINEYAENGVATMTMNLSGSYDVSAVYFDTAFIAAVGTSNAKPKSVKVSYLDSNGNSLTATRAMSSVSSVRTLTLGTGTAKMTRYIENIGATGVSKIQLTFELSDASEWNNLYLDEILVVGTKSGSVSAIARDGQTVLNASLSGAYDFNGSYQSGLWLTHHAFTALSAMGTVTPIELIVDLNKDAHNNSVSTGNHLVTGVDVGFAVDTDAICPSSIVISVQQENSTEWVTVGGSIYTDYGTSSTPRYVSELIPLTSSDASDVKAARVKITFYVDRANGDYGTHESGTWGTWLALSHLHVNGGQYIGTVEPDGATAAYHANYLQNTDMTGRSNFGDVDNTDIWNTISWKSARYTTANSGYLEATGNITVGKVYWASQPISGSASAKVDGGTTYALNPEVTGDTVKADTNVALNAEYAYSGSAPYDSQYDKDYYSDKYNGVAKTTSTGYSTGKLTDGVVPDYSKNPGSSETRWAVWLVTSATTITFKLDKGYTVSKAAIKYFKNSDTIGAVYSAEISATVSTSTDGTNFTNVSNASSSTATTTSSTSGKYLNVLTVSFTSATATYVRISIPARSTGRMALGEVEIYGSESTVDTTPPVISNVVVSDPTPDGYWVTCTVTDNVGVDRVQFPTWTAKDGQDDIQKDWETSASATGTYLRDNKWQYYVSVADHNNESGLYYTHIYAYDVSGKSSGHNCGDINVPAAGNIVNLAPKGTYAYSNMLPDEGMYHEPGEAFQATENGCLVGQDYEVPDYSATFYTQDFSKGGTGHRTQMDYYAKGKLNDGKFAIYSPGVAPYYSVGWAEKINSGKPMTITFDLGGIYKLTDVYFNSAVAINYANANKYVVTYYFSADNITWTEARNGTWTANGTVPYSKDDTATQYPVYKNSVTAPSGSFQFVKIVFSNTSITENNIIYIDEIIINGDMGEETPIDTSEKNWALSSNGGQYKGVVGDLVSKTNNAEDNWDVYHSGKLNNGTIDTVTPTNNNTTDYIEIYTGYYKGYIEVIAFKLSELVDVTKVNVYTAMRATGGNRAHPNSTTVYVVETEEQALNYAQATAFGSSSSPTTYNNSSYTKQFSVSGAATGKYVVIVLNCPSSAPYTSITEIEIIGTQSLNLTTPEITSHYDGQEVGFETELEWAEVTTKNGALVTYTVTVTDMNGKTVIAGSALPVNNLTLSNFNNEVFTAGEGDYTITVTAKANGWLSSTASVNVYYSPKYIVRFYAADDGLLASGGATANYVQFAFEVGSDWSDEDIRSAVSGVSVMPYIKNGTTMFFDKWTDANGEAVTVPTSGEIASNYTFYASYSIVDNMGTMNNTRLTDGVVFNGTGNKADYSLQFVNNTEAYDYMIIDLGAIYYSLTEFDVSFYQMGSKLPFQITFEVSSKLYVPTIAQGAAFTEEDWQYVAVVTENEYKKNSYGYSFIDSAHIARIIEGAFGRYIRVKFWYSADCQGVYVDEVIVNGSDDYVRTNVAAGKTAAGGTENAPVLTDGATTDSVTASEFTVDLGDVKAGLYSFELVGATEAATLYISAGGTSANDFHKVETINGSGSYKLSDKTSARLVRVVFENTQTVSEFRVYADAGRENYYTSTENTAEIALANGTTVLDNVISLGAVPTITANGATVSGGNASVLTDGNDPGFANGSMLAQNGNYKLWYNVYKTKVGTDYVLNMRIVTDWTPKLDSTAFTAVIGSKTYKFEFNGDVNKGFVILQSGSATPDSYSAVREDNGWVVDFTVLYTDIGATESSNITYTVTAYEGATEVVTTGSKTFNGRFTDGWSYTDQNSTWTTITATTDNTVTVTLDLGQTYYGINKLAITALESTDYSAPKSVLFQTSDDNSTWHNVGYTSYSEIGDYRYYPQQQTGYAKAYNLSVTFAGASARYVRAVLTTDSGDSVAIQEFWVNAYDEPPKESGGDSAQASFDYKMLWDDDNLYIAFRYEEDEVPFYTANHQYYETYSVTYTTGEYTTDGNVVTPAEGTPLNAFSISNLFFEQDTDYFRLEHTVTKIGDDNTVTSGYYTGYSTKRLDNFKLYKVSSVTFNQGASVTNGRIQYGKATLATSIETSSIVTASNDNGKDSIGSDSVLNGYILVSDGYALSQQIGGYSLTSVSVTVDGDTIPADQISDDLVWYFEETSAVDSLPDTAKALGKYHVYALCRESKNSTDSYQYFLDSDTKMAYKKFYLNRAYQGEMWENVYTFRSGLADLTSLNTDASAYNDKNQYFPGNNNWNFDYNSTTGMWSIYLRSQGKLSFGNAYDNIDGASALRIFLSAANLNDTARYDYGNYDIVIDAYVLDDNELILSDGTVLPLDSTLPSEYYHSNHKADYNTAWNGYKTVELKATALGMTPETNDYAVDFDTYQAKAKFSQSENGQSVLTVEIAIPFSQLGFTMEKENGVVTKWGNFYTKTGIEHPLGKRTLMQFDADYSYTTDNKPQDDILAEIDEFYYYVDASEFGFILQYAPEGKGYQDLSYTDGEGYSTVSSVRGEVLNTTNGTEIEYTPTTFEISKILSTRTDNNYADIIAELAERDAFSYVEEDGIYYFTSQFDHERTFNQRGTISTELTIPAGGAYFSFDWRVDSEPGADSLSFWLEETDTWNAYYKDWIATYNCGYPFRSLDKAEENDSSNTKLNNWFGIIDWNDASQYELYSNVLHEKGFPITNGSVQIRNDACVAVISGYEDTTRAPEQYQLSIWKESKRSYTGSDYPAGTEANVVPVNVDDTLVFSPLTDASNGHFTHVWDWNNVTVWIPNTSGSDISYTFTWMYWKNGTRQNTFSATDGRGDDSAQITNFRLSTTDELGYWKNTENWDTLRLDATIADPTDTMLGVKQLAKTTVEDGEMTPVISATTNDPANSVTNTFGKEGFFSLSYAAIAQKDVVGTTTQTTTYAQTKNRLSISAANVPVADIPSYKNNAIVFTQDYAENLTESGVLNDWTVLELKYNSLYNTWVVSRLFEEGVDKTKFNIYADNNTIVIAVNYYYSKNPGTAYGETSEAIYFGYQNREVLRVITPQLRYTQSSDGERIVETDADTEQLEVTQLITSNIFVRENYNIATGKMYSLRNNPTYTDSTYAYMENWFMENNTEDSLAAFLAVYSETPLYYVSKNGEIDGMDDTDGDYTKAFIYNYNSYSQFATAMGLTNRPMRFDTNQYGNVLYVPAGVGQLTDGKKMSVYSNKYLLQTLEEYAIGYFVSDTMGTPDADTVENIYPEDRVYSYQQEVDLKHDMYEVFEDVHTREENIILDLGTVEYGLSAFNIRFLGGGEDGVSFPTSVEFSISTDGLSYSYIGSVALDDTGYNSKIFGDAYATIVFSGATDTVYGNTVADYTFNLQTVGVTARYIKATIMNHSAQNAKTFITEYQVIQNAVCPDKLPTVSGSSWIDVSADANLMYIDTLEKWDNSLNKPYSFALSPTTAGYLFAEDEGYPDIDGHNTAGIYKAGELTDGKGGASLYKLSEEGNTDKAPTIQEIKDMSVGWMKAYAPEVSLTFDLGAQKNIGYVCVYALQSKDSVDKITQPYNITAYVAESQNSDWLKVATVNAKDNDSSEVTLKGVDVVLDVDGTGQEGVGGYTIYKYTLAFARDGELAQQISNMRYVKVVAETDGGEDGWICLTEVEVFEGHPCYPVYDLTDSKYEKTALGLTEEQKDNQVSEVRPTFFRGYYDSDLYAEELPAYVYNGESGSYNKKYVFNREESEDYTVGYVFGNVEQRALDGRGVPYFYGGDQLIFRVTNDQLNCNGYDYHGDWVSSYKLLAESRIYYTSVSETSSVTTRLFTTTAVPTPMTRCNVLARDRFTCEVSADYNWEDSYYYLPIYLMNSLDYLKNSGYLGNDGTEQYICMPTNKVELTGNLVWDTNYESDYAEYADDKNGISLNLAPLGAKTNTETVTYNSKEYAPSTSLRFGSIWYIDDSAYYNTHTHMQQYGTLVMTTKNLGKYFTDSFTSTSKYTSVFEDYGLKLTKLDGITEVTGVQQITGVSEVVKLTNVNEVIKLSGVTELEGEDGVNAKFMLTIDGEVHYYTCDNDIDTIVNGGRVWTSNDNYWYCANSSVGTYKFTYNGKYYYCKENVNTVNYEKDGSFFYCSESSVVNDSDVYTVNLKDGTTVYYYCANGEQTAIKSMTRYSSGAAMYWTYNEDYPSWTFVKVEDDVSKYYYSASYNGVAGNYICKDGIYYATSSTVVYDDIIVKDGEYWGGKTKQAYDMLVSVYETVGADTENEEKVMAALDTFLDYINKYGEGKLAHNGAYEDFGGIAMNSRANKYYYFTNISTHLVPESYDDDKVNNPLYDTDSQKDKQNLTDLIGVYNYDQRYLEFDAIIAGIPESQKGSKIVAVPYVIYANNYEFLEFGEHLGKGDQYYVESTWHEIFSKYYGGELSGNDMRYYVYGGGVARSINDVLNTQADLNKQYN